MQSLRIQLQTCSRCRRLHQRSSSGQEVRLQAPKIPPPPLSNLFSVLPGDVSSFPCFPGLPGPSNNSMLLAVVTSDGRVWTWDVDVHHDRSRRAVPAGPLSAPLLPRPRLRGLLPALPRSISTFTVCPTPIAASTSPQDSLSRAVVKLAAVTGTGMVEIISLRAGLGRLLTPVVSVALEVCSATRGLVSLM